MTAIRTLILGATTLAVLSMASATCLADNETIIGGGGIIRDGVGIDESKISFSLDVYADDDIPEGVGHFQIRFHRLPLHPDLEQTSFFSSDITGLYLAPGDFESTPFTFIKVWADGRLGGEAGWSIVVRLSDFGTPVKKKDLPFNHADAVRIQLFDPDGWAVYDTAWEGEFSREQAWRAVLDGGNIALYIE